MALQNETDLCRLMVATDHARTDKARLALVVGFGATGGATRLGLALSSTCGKLGREARDKKLHCKSRKREQVSNAHLQTRHASLVTAGYEARVKA